MANVFRLACLVLFVALSHRAFGATSVTQHGITWSFAEDQEVGQFVNGDYWVVGPVTITAITTDLHDEGFTPGPGDDGSMVNPGATGRQGYDASLNSYRPELNASLVGGKRVSPDNPLVLKAGSSLVSMVSWLYRSQTDKEKGTPRFNGGTGAPRPVTRSGAVLTVLEKPAPDGSFRPPYCGADKTIHFNINDINLQALKTLDPVEKAPDPTGLAKRMQRPWIDHVHEFLGAMVHPSRNMPQYGREMGKLLADYALLASLDFKKLPGNPDKVRYLIPYLQYGIDCAGIADAGGGWPENGGHGPGRKLPILVAGHVFGNEHLKQAGQWDTAFQDDMQTFYVSAESVAITNSKRWKPDSRARDKEPYEFTDLGMPEWGVRHTRRPTADNRGWHSPYRSVNGAVIPGTALAAAILGLRDDWNHPAYFDYAIRYMDVTDGGGRGANAPTGFAKAMWRAYAEQHLLDAPKITQWKTAGANDTAPVSIIHATISKPVDPQTLNKQAVSILAEEAGDKSGLVAEVKLEGRNTIVIELVSPLPAGDRYAVSLADTIRTTGGEQLAGDRTEVFATKAE